MKKTLISVLFALLIILMFPSCATIFSKSIYPVSINTSPVGSNISIVNKKGIEVFKGVSPVTVNLKSSSGYFSPELYQIKISSPGFGEKVVTVSSSLDGWYFGNILLGGLIGMLIVDPASGAMYTIKDRNINVSLDHATSANNATLNILDYNVLSPDAKKNLIALH